MVYKAIKKSRFRQQYSHLSSGAAQSYNIADFYTADQSHVYLMSTTPTQKIGGLHIESTNCHRRHKSAGPFAVGFSSPPEDRRMEAARTLDPPKQLVRFRSHRLFSCVTGAQKMHRSPLGHVVIIPCPFSSSFFFICCLICLANIALFVQFPAIRGRQTKTVMILYKS